MYDMIKESRHLSELFEEVLNQAGLLFMVLDDKAVIRSANPYAKKELGEDIVGQVFSSVILDFYNTFDLEALRAKEDAVHPLNLKRKTGLPQTYYFRFRNQGGLTYAVGELDNEELETVRKEILGLNEELSNLTRELHKKNAQLETLNQEKNQFLGMAAHDLRKPIGLILSYSEFLMDEAAENLTKEHQGFLSTIQKSCTFMKRIVDDFLDVSAIEAGKFDLDLKPAGLAEVLEQGLRLNMYQAAKKGIHLNVESDNTLPKLMIDPSKIEQVITNLVSNAIEHTFPETQVAVRLASEKNRITFSVTDQGPGIPKDELGKLFKPFEKTSVKKTGGEKSTGLGMLITRKIIEAHQGEIWVESEENKGTHISFTLPVKGAACE